MPEPSSDPTTSPLPPGPAMDELPPFLKTWPRVYAGVILYLAGLLLVLTVISGLFHYN